MQNIENIQKLSNKKEQLLQERDYQRLCLRRDVVKLILDLRIWKELIKNRNNFDGKESINRSHLLQMLTEMPSILESRLNRIVEGVCSGLINPSALDTADDDLYSCLHVLRRKYPTLDSEIGILDNEIIYYKYCCPNCRPLGVELADFIDSFSLNIEWKNSLSKYTEFLFSKTEYTKDSPEHKYLLTENTNIDFYKAYSKIDTCPIEQAAIEVNRMIKEITTSHNGKDLYYAEIIYSYLTKRKFPIAADIYRSLLNAPNWATTSAKNVLATIHARRKSQMDMFKTEIELAIKEIILGESKTKDVDLGELFKKVSSLPLDVICAIFSVELNRYENSDIYADFIYNYLRISYGESIPNTFLTYYNSTKQQIQNSRKDLVLVLKAAAEKKGSK